MATKKEIMGKVVASRDEAKDLLAQLEAGGFFAPEGRKFKVQVSYSIVEVDKADTSAADAIVLVARHPFVGTRDEAGEYAKELRTEAGDESGKIFMVGPTNNAEAKAGKDYTIRECERMSRVDFEKAKAVKATERAIKALADRDAALAKAEAALAKATGG